MGRETVTRNIHVRGTDYDAITQSRPSSATHKAIYCDAGPSQLSWMLLYGVKNCKVMARPRLNRKVVRISVSLEEQMYADVFALADQNDVSVAWLIRKAVAELLERRRDEFVPQLPLLISRTETSGSAK